jgi:hemerythrin
VEYAAPVCSAMTFLQPSAWLIAEIARKDDLLNGQLARLDALLPCTPGEEYCQRCDHVVPCKKELDSFFENMLGFMQMHFGREESVMHLVESCLDQKHVFDDHKEAHANLMEKLVELVSEGGTPAEERTVMQQLIRTWLDEHFHTADQQLLEALHKL